MLTLQNAQGLRDELRQRAGLRPERRAVHPRRRTGHALLAREVETGLIHVNDQRVNDELFSGERESGIGRFGGEWVMDEMTRAQWVTVQHEPRQYSI